MILKRDLLTDAYLNNSVVAGSRQLAGALLEEDAGRSEGRVCDKCGQSSQALHKCGQCRKVCYCSAVCQKEAWPEHKLVCVAMQGDGALPTLVRPALGVLIAALNHPGSGMNTKRAL